jgi:ATP-dependent RNA helicase DDX55/SPB4
MHLYHVCIVFQKLSLQKHEIGALILSPTRELASQISQVLDVFLQNLPHLKQQMFIGGANSTVNNDIAKVTKAD